MIEKEHNKRNKLMLSVFYQGLLRSDELAKLKIEDLHLENLYEWAGIVINGKNGKSRNFYLS